MMKQKFVLLLMFLTVMALNGCGVNAEQTTAAVNPQTNETTPESTYSLTCVVEGGDSRMKLQIGEYVFRATFVDNSTAEALKEMLANGPIVINMHDYGNMEKVGSLGTSLPRNDEQITTEAGDLILYQGNAFVIYYAPNSWNFTRIGKIDDVTPDELKRVLGSGDVTVTLSLE
jgi:hypothetical protein